MSEINTELDLACIIANPYNILNYHSSTQNSVVQRFINKNIEPACRTLIYKLHLERYKLLDDDNKRHRKSYL